MNDQNTTTTPANPAATQLPPDSPVRARILEAARTVRNTTPLAQSVTNFVTVNFVANAQLAAGGTAAMSYLPDDVLATAEICNASYINVGTLQPYFREAFPEIARGFKRLGHPWVLDPVAAGIGDTRTAILTAFRDTPPTVVRGNASEIITLATMWGLGAPFDKAYDDAAAASDTDTDSDSNADGHNGTDGHAAHGAAEATDADITANRPQGVESVDDVDSARDAAVALARFIGGAVAVSGAVDLVTDGTTVYRLPGGSAYMTKITGAGCSLGGVVGTYLAVADPLTAALGASALYNQAGSVAGRKAHGPGSFQVEFLDALWATTPEQIAAAPITVESAR